MYKMLALAGLFAAWFGSASADSPESKKFNLKHHERSINAYQAKMRNEGNETSKEFAAVVQGMKMGNYSYDLETARKVMREVYAHRLPHAPKVQNPQ